MNQDLELKLQAWVDGELTDAEAKRIGNEIAGNAEAIALVASLHALKSAFEGNELSVTVPETREFYWSKIQRQIESEERTAARPVPARGKFAWQKWLAPVAGFGSLACILFMAIRPIAPAPFDEISATGEEMQSITYHDQTSGMTVVWLADTDDGLSTDSPTAPASKAPEIQQQDNNNGNASDSDVEME
jgi:hypothetical protein